MSMKATIEKVGKGSGEELVLRFPLNGAHPSKSGKMQLIATTNGFTTTDAVYNGNKVRVSVNAGF